MISKKRKTRKVITVTTEVEAADDDYTYTSEGYMQVYIAISIQKNWD